MNLKLLFCLGAGLTLLAAPAARSQALPPDTVLALARQAAMGVYLEAVGLESQIYNGTEYISYDMPHITGHQFFLTDKEVPAEVRYSGATYSQVPLLYDIHRDQLVLTHPTSDLKLKLLNDKVASFNIRGYSFIRLDKDSLAAGSGKTGFYQVLVTGPVQALAKRYKDLQESATREGMKGEFRDINRYYLLRDHALIPVKSKNDVYKALPESRKELQQYARDHKLKFGRTREAGLVALIRHYNSLTAKP